MRWIEDWNSEDLVDLEGTEELHSFAMDPAWAEAAISSGYATSFRIGLHESGSLRAAALGLRRGRLGISKVVCGSSGAVGILAAEPHAGARLIEEIQRRWRPSILQIFASQAFPTRSLAWQPSFTFHLDLRQPLNQIHSLFEKRTRNSLESASRRGVITECVTSVRERDRAFDLVRQTASSKGFVLPTRSYLDAIHGAFRKAGFSEIVQATRGEDLLAVVHVIGARGLASWWKGGASPEGYRLSATVLAQWRAISLARERGFRTYDFGGTHPTSPVYAGIHRFKSSFGGKLITGAVGLRSTVVSRAVKRLLSV